MRALRVSQRVLQNQLVFAIVISVLVLIVTGQSLAQLSSASVNGTVRDSSGAVIPDATVVLRNIQTSVENTTVSNASGVYSIFSITPGEYTIKATASGFGTKEVPQFTLTVGHIATINFSLTVGSQKSTVTVQSATPQLNVSSASLGTVISTKEVNDIPLNGRNFTQLLTLTPGVSPVSTGQNANEGAVSSGGGWMVAAAIGSDVVFPSVNGQTNRSNFFLTDGMDNFGEFISSYAVPPIIDAIQEFKVVSHADSAEYGGVLGGVINVTTKSGTNQLHGSAWEYARNKIFDARTYFLPKNVPKTPYSQNQFGGSIGGPVVVPHYNGKNKTFFFGAYQGFRYSQLSNAPLHIPTAAELSGDESSWPTQIYNPFSFRPDPLHPGQFIGDPFPGNQIPANLIQKPLVDYANFAYPTPGPVFDSSGDNALDPTPITQVQNEWDIRVDQKIGANDSVFFRYSALNSTVTESPGLPGDPESVAIPSRDWGGSYVHVFSPSLVLQAQIAHTTMYMNTSYFFTKSTDTITGELNLAPTISKWVISPTRVPLPDMSINGYSNNPGEYANTNTATDDWEYSGNLDKTWKTHTLRFGAGYTSIFNAAGTAFPYEGFGAQNTADPNPADTVNQGFALASYLLGVPDYYYFVNSKVASRPGGVGYGYAQDSWKVTRKLTFNYGLRYDVQFFPPFGKKSLNSAHGGPYIGDFDFSNGTYILQALPPSCNAIGVAPCIPGDGTLPAHVVVSPNDKIAVNEYSNFGPHLGFAYLIGDKTVVRGAFGIVYDSWAAINQMTQNVSSTWPDVGLFNAPADLNLPSSTSATPTITAYNPLGNSTFLPAATPFTQTGNFYAPHRLLPRSEQYNIGIERQLNSNTAATLNYVGMASQRLDYGGPYNTALTPGPGDPQSRALYPYMAITPYDRPVGQSSYNSLQASLVKRYTDGWSYNVAYTWSKTMDCGTDGWWGTEGTNAQDPYNICGYGSRSVAGYDVTNQLSVDMLYQVPIGKGGRFSTGNRVADYILGNWQINNIFQAHSGLPFTPSISSDIPNTGNGTEYLDVVGNPHLSKQTAEEWFNTAAYAVPAGYTYGTAGRNSLRSQADWELDSSVFRLIPVGDGRQFEFRAEAFNLLNNVVLGQPFSDYNTGPQFGTINSTYNVARELQLALKFTF